METPALEELMGTYLHQDYDIVGTVDDNVDTFLRESPELAVQLPREVAWALDTYSSEQDLHTFVHELGCQIRPLEDEGGYRGWLTEIARRVAAATQN
ncbi:contact-dependent growth inhibition system immunity protein [Nocardioides sp. MAHUQ-72]|uniref:contact-dependent growth inhibition system immunity protein n=1 Tax=unclassified Nocardioides TaxID=2615069 RepID=UPI00360ABB04